MGVESAICPRDRADRSERRARIGRHAVLRLAARPGGHFDLDRD